MDFSMQWRLSSIMSCVLIAGVVFPGKIAGQKHEEPIIAGWSTTIRSEVMHEERTLQIHLPQGYETSSDSYPVLILLDSRTDFRHVIGITDFLAENYKAFPLIVVGVANTNRTRDLTPALRAQNPLMADDVGGADRFLEFIASELLPFIDRKYRSSSYRILVGRSHGGLFALHAFITQPDLFNAYIAVDPSIWWDEAALYPRLISHLVQKGGMNRTLFVANATRDKQLLESLDAGSNAEMWLGFRKKAQLASYLESSAPTDLRWAVQEYPNDDHGSVTHRSVYDGLELVFAVMNKSAADLFELAREGGVEALDAYYAPLSAQYGTLAGSPESVVNRLGYGFLQTDLEKAFALLKSNVDRFPESANAHDSLGDAYVASQQFDQALACYRAASTIAKKQRHPNRAIYRQKFQQMQDYLDTR